MKRPHKQHKKHKPKREPHDGAIQVIKQWFIEPFIRNLGLDRYEKNFELGLEHFFCVETRDISVYSAVDQFTLPGARVGEHPSILIRGEGQRKVAIGDKMLVRTDTTMPGRVDVEYQDQIFHLTAAEWNFAREKLTLARRK